MVTAALKGAALVSNEKFYLLARSFDSSESQGHPT